MFGIGTTEFLVIIVVAILVLGPEHLPRIMRTVSKVMSDFRRVSTEFQRTMNLEASQEDWERQQAEARKKKRKKKQGAPHPESENAVPPSGTQGGDGIDKAADAPSSLKSTADAQSSTGQPLSDSLQTANHQAPADELAADLTASPPSSSAKQESVPNPEQADTTKRGQDRNGSARQDAPDQGAA